MKEDVYMKFGIDLGHGVGPDRGAVGNIAEETIINAVGKLVISKLKSLGHSVVELRPDSAVSVQDSLQQRYSKADYCNVDMCVSIHANAGGGVGTEVFTYRCKEVPQARAILNNIVNLGFKNRGIKDGSGLAMVKRPKATAMLIEICFVDSADVDKYNSIGSEAIANAIVCGLTGQTVKSSTNGEWMQDSTGWWYRYADGSHPASKWEKIDGEWYYFDDKGYAYQNRWLKDNGKWYYFKDSCKMAHGEILTYKFKDNGEYIQ